MLSSCDLASNPIVYFGFRVDDEHTRRIREGRSLSVILKEWVSDFAMRDFHFKHGEVVFLYDHWPSTHHSEIDEINSENESVIAFSVAKGDVYLRSRTFAQRAGSNEIRLNDAYYWIGFRPSSGQFQQIVTFAVMQKGKPAERSLWRSMMLWGRPRGYEDSWNCYALMVRVAQFMGFLEDRNPWLVTLDELHNHMMSHAFDHLRTEGLRTPAEDFQMMRMFME